MLDEELHPANSATPYSFTHQSEAGAASRPVIGRSWDRSGLHDLEQCICSGVNPTTTINHMVSNNSPTSDLRCMYVRTETRIAYILPHIQREPPPVGFEWHHQAVLGVMPLDLDLEAVVGDAPTPPDLSVPEVDHDAIGLFV